MNAVPATLAPVSPQRQLDITCAAKIPWLRALAWADDYLYASRGYQLLRARIGTEFFADLHWEPIASIRPAWWRKLTAKTRLSSRAFRDGFHALAVLPTGHIVAAIPGAIASLAPGKTEFCVTHCIRSGTRPLHITVVPSGTVFWGEYFDNSARDEVHIYASTDCGLTWSVAYTFAKGQIRHVHNIVYDPWGNCLWVLTGDYGRECRILRASCDFSQVDIVLDGNQQARAVALVPTEGGVYFSSDTPLEQNHVYYLDRQGTMTKRTSLTSSSIYGCSVGGHIFFSTMVEPSKANPDRHVRVYVSREGSDWTCLLTWQKDLWPFGVFQYGNALLPDGNNRTRYLAVTTIAVKSEDLVLSLYSIHS